MNLFAAYYRKKGKRLLDERNLLEARNIYNKVSYDRLTNQEQIRVALLHHELGDSERALELLGRTMTLAPSDFAYERRAHILRELDREEEALTDLNEAIRLNPVPFMYWYTRGLTLKDLGRYGEASRDLEECVKREPDDSVVSTYYELGMCYFHAEQYIEAERIFRKVLTYYDQEIPIFAYRLAKVLVLQGKEAEAIPYLEQAIERLGLMECLPDNGEKEIFRRTGYGPGAFRTFQAEIDRTAGFRQDLVVIRLNLGAYAEALETVNGAVEQYPEKEELYMLRAIVYRHLGKWDASSRDLEQALALGIRQTDVDHETILLLRMQNREELVPGYLLNRMAADPDQPLLYYWLAESFSLLGRKEEALEANKQLLSLEPDDPLNGVQRGDILKELGLYRQAVECYTKAIEFTDRAALRMKRSYAYYQDERCEEALLDLRHASELDPELLETGGYHHAQGHILDGLGRKEEAVEAFTQAIRLSPEAAVYYESRAKCYLEMDRTAEAEIDCEAGYRADPVYSDLLSLRGYIRYRLEDYEGAQMYARQYAAMHPEDPVALYHVGLASYRLREGDTAAEAFNQALELAPGFGSCYLYKGYLAYDQLEFEEATDCLAKWNSCSFQELSLEERIARLHDLDGFDEEVREGAEERIKEWYDGPVYLS